MSNLDETVRSFLGASCLALDDQDYPTFLQHCDEGFHYQVKAYSDELGKEMVWLEHDRKGFESLLSMIPNHVRMQGRFSRQVVPSKWTSGSDGIEVTSHLSMFHTQRGRRHAPAAGGPLHRPPDAARERHAPAHATRRATRHEKPGPGHPRAHLSAMKEQSNAV